MSSWPELSPCTTSGQVTLVFQSEEVNLVVSKRDVDGNDLGLENSNWVSQAVDMKSARGTALKLEDNGFEIVLEEEGQENIDFFNNDEIISKYYKRCESLVRAVIGENDKAPVVKAFDHNLRCKEMHEANRKIEHGGIIQKPVTFVHGDYTKTSAPRRLEKLAEAPKVNDSLRQILGDTPLLSSEEMERAMKGRYMFVNVWRSIDRENPVLHSPLACCDAKTTTMESLLTFEIHYADRIGENYFAKYRPCQSWYYYPQMTHKEALLIKQWDSHGALANGAEMDAREGMPATFALHTAFFDPNSEPDSPSRQSIEVRLVVIW